MKIVKKTIVKVLFNPKSNPGIHHAVMIVTDGIDSAAKIFKTSGIEYAGTPVYMPLADSFITDEVEVTMTDKTKPAKPKKVKDKK